MIEFILNNKKISTESPKGMLLVDFIRENQNLKGTKSACREGDCGSCTVIEGNLVDGKINYRAIASCITPLGNVHGKHIVTIEGLSNNQISPIQKALVDAAAIQCGYCTPGIVLSLTAYALSNEIFSFETAKDAIAGNICRCTGYKSIERALETILGELKQIKKGQWLNELIAQVYIPEYFKNIPEMLTEIQVSRKKSGIKQFVGGGTDLFVQKPDMLCDAELDFLTFNKQINKIKIKGNHCSIGAACKVSDLAENEILVHKIQGFDKNLRLIGSHLIRNMATVGGNIANASPIGDLSIIFMALDADLRIASGKKENRRVKLKDFFKAYKKIDLVENEFIESINFNFPDKKTLYSFEKVSKREYLDIASVNSAITIKVKEDTISQVHLSFGGVAPIPLYAEKTCQFLKTKPLNSENIRKAVEILETEIKPIDDIRGSAAYKSLLTRQLFFAHFIKLFPGKFEKELINLNPFNQ